MLTETESIIALVYVIFALSSIHWITGVKFDEYYKKNSEADQFTNPWSWLAILIAVLPLIYLFIYH